MHGQFFKQKKYISTTRKQNNKQKNAYLLNTDFIHLTNEHYISRHISMQWSGPGGTHENKVKKYVLLLEEEIRTRNNEREKHI